MHRNALALSSFLMIASAACAGSQATAAKTSASADGAHAAKPAITEDQVKAAQVAWCDALLAIGKADATGGDAKAMASEVLSSAYAYATGPVLFKPTLAFGAQTFRFDQQGALAYFVGGDPAYPNDSGFALKGWTSCRPDVRSWYTDGDVALAMGNVYFEDGKGNKVMVDKTFGYHRSAGGALQIVLHHSSLPYTPPAK